MITFEKDENDKKNDFKNNLNSLYMNNENSFINKNNGVINNKGIHNNGNRNISGCEERSPNNIEIENLDNYKNKNNDYNKKKLKLKYEENKEFRIKSLKIKNENVIDDTKGVYINQKKEGSRIKNNNLFSKDIESFNIQKENKNDKSFNDKNREKLLVNKYTNHNLLTVKNINMNKNYNTLDFSSNKQIKLRKISRDYKNKKSALDPNLIINECKNNSNTSSITQTQLKDSERQNLCDINFKSELFSAELNFSKFKDKSRDLSRRNSPRKKKESPKPNFPFSILEEPESLCHLFNSKEIKNKKKVFIQKLISKKKSEKLELSCLQKFKFLFFSCINLKRIKNNEDYKLLMLMRLIDEKIENYFDYSNIIIITDELSILKEILLRDHQKLIVNLLGKENLHLLDNKTIVETKPEVIEKEIENEAITHAVNELFRTSSLEFSAESFRNPVKLNKNIIEVLDEKIKIRK